MVSVSGREGGWGGGHVSHHASHHASIYSITILARCALKIFEECIDSVSNVSPDGFAAIKITALGPPALLKRISTALVEVNPDSA